MKNKQNIKRLSVICMTVCTALTGCSVIDGFISNSDGRKSSTAVTDYDEATRTKVKYHQAAEQDVQSAVSSEHKAIAEKTKVSSAAEYFLQNLSDNENLVFKQIYSGLSRYENNISIEPETIKQEEICDFISFCTSVSPDINYISPEYVITIDENGYVIALDVTYEKEEEQSQSEKNELEQTVDEILQGLDDGWSDYDKVKYLHDRIVLRCSYSENGIQPYSAYGCLVQGESVCEGYSKAMLTLCQRAGIKCIPVLGKGIENGEQEPHIWNKIMLDGQWYNFDLTWDDPISQMGEDYIRYDYFAVTDEEISMDHIVDSNRFMEYPEAVSTENNYYVLNGLLVDENDNPQDIALSSIQAAMAENQDYARIKCADKSVYDLACEEIFGKNNQGSAAIFEILRESSENSPYDYDYTSYTIIKNESLFTITIKLR